MADDSAGECWCKCCIKFIFAVGLTILLVWLVFPHKPKCSIQYFYVPALNKSLNSQPLNTTLNFMVRLDNPNIDQGIYYDDVHVSLYNTFNSSTSSLLLADYTMPRFYQGHHKKAKKWAQVLPLNNQTVLPSVLPNGLAVFRLDLKTQVRFKVMFWKTKRYRIEVGANVEVNGEGSKAAKKGIKMKKSSSSPLKTYFPVCVLMNLLVFFAIL